MQKRIDKILAQLTIKLMLDRLPHGGNISSIALARL